MIKILKEYIIGLYILIVAFSYSFSAILQYALGLGEENSMLKATSSIILMLALIWAFKEVRLMMSVRKPMILLFCLILLYYITSLLYEVPKLFWSYFLSMVVRMWPAVIVGVIVANRRKYLDYMLKAMLPFMLLYTFVVFSVESISIGQAIFQYAYGGFNYQTLSYYASFAYGMNLFLMTDYKFQKLGKVKYFYLFLLLLQLYLVIAPGGRGALVLTTFFTIYFGLKKVSWKKFLLLMVLLSIVYILFNYLSSDKALLGGFTRLSNFFGDREAIENDYRMMLYRNAINCWIESPLYGYGIGSIWPKLGFYSHNLFTDLLCEGGVILLIIFLLLLFKFYKKLRKLIKLDSSYEIFMVIFLCGFVLILFSGYYTSDSSSWFSITAVLMCNKNIAIRKQ